MNDAITREHRTKLLTRRVRAIMRAFKKNPSYLSGAPDIVWDGTFIPTELYANLEAELASLDAKESQKEKEREREKEKERENEKARESQRRDMEKQMAKEKAKVAQNDKGKAKETSQVLDDTDSETSLFGTNDNEDSILADVAEPSEAMQNESKDTSQDKKNPTKRKWKQKASESESTASYTEGDTSADEAKPPAKRVNRKKSIGDAPPCRRCIISKMECIPNGLPGACKSCRKLKQGCSLARDTNRRSAPQTTASRPSKKSIEDDEDFVDQLKPPPPKASNAMGKGSSSTSSFSYRNSDLELLQKQLKVSQEELRIAQQELQLANSRIEAQKKLYESQRDLYEAQLAGYRRSQVRGQGSSGKAKGRA